MIGEDSGDRPPGPALTGAFRAEVRDWLAAHVPAEPLPSAEYSTKRRAAWSHCLGPAGSGGAAGQHFAGRRPSAPTVVRMLLGEQLRQLREARGMTYADAGWTIRGSHSKISRLEMGRSSFKRRDVADLLTLYR